MQKFFGSLQHAWPGSRQTRIVSRTIYEFRIDERILRIRDDDFIFMSQDLKEIPEALYSEKITLKNIRRTATNIDLGISVPPAIFSEDMAFQGKQPQGVELETETISKGLDKLTAVTMSIDLENAFASGDRYHVHLTYDVPLNLRNNVLMFSGAIQPSDYDSIRRIFDVKFAEKFLATRILSKRRLRAYFFLPRPMDYSPDPKIAKKNGDMYEIIEVLHSEMKDWHRAHYFSVFAPLETEENN